MSKKTKAEKLARRRRRAPRRHRRERKRHANPAKGFAAINESALIDAALGAGFVEFLRCIGIRDKIAEIVFSNDDPEVGGPTSPDHSA